MDLLPKPDQVAAAAGNIAQLLLRGGLADVRPLPRALVEEGDHHAVHHYRPDVEGASGAAAGGHPVLLVASLAAPAACYDLRRGCSVIEHLVAAGRATYLVEYDDVSFRDPSVGLDHWVQDVVPRAVRAVSRHAGGGPVHVIGWGLGGVFSLLAAADAQDLPLASLALLGAPVDVSRVPLVAPTRSLLTSADLPPALARAARLIGTPAPLARMLQLGPVQRLGRPAAVAVHLDDAEWLAQVEAVGRLIETMSAYPGRAFGQLYHRFAPGNALASGTVELGGRRVSLSAVAAPTLVVAGATDAIAPVTAVRAVLPLLTGAAEVRFEIVPGGHLGMLTGRGARAGTWTVIDEWLAHTDAPMPAAAKPGRRKARGGSRAETAPRAPSPASGEAIGANPNRRFSSAASRNLSP